MSSERWAAVERLYHEALGRHPDARGAFLASACGGDAELRRDVESLLDQSENAEAFLAASVAAAAAAVVATPGGTSREGARVGVYDVGPLIGAGGMGQVYRARDTRLQRDVAIKVLPPAFTGSHERLARLEREARVLASLNHVNIATIYGIEDGALVMELVEGQTLGRGLPVADVLAIARQLVDALDYAHEKGIVHRDLKPANVKITPDGVVKVLDFGLAKARRSESPSIDDGGTREGVILGTTAYLSPEQARGQAVDKRTDIWAFGCVLYEMIAGRPAFGGETTSDVIARILERELDDSAIPAATPPGLRRLLKRCLEKDPKRRLRDIADARMELDDPDFLDRTGAESTGSSRLQARRWRAAAIAGVPAAAVFASLWIWNGDRAARRADQLISNVMIDVRPAASLLGSPPLERSQYGRFRPSRSAMALSPDGRTVAFTAVRDSKVSLYLRSLDKPEASAVAGTDGANNPFFSPDGRSVGFWADGALRRVSLGGGLPVKIADVPVLPIYGASWTPGGRIAFGQRNTIWSVAEGGGLPEELTKRLPGEARHLLPHLLPGGEWLLYTVQPSANDWQTTFVVAQSLKTGERKPLLEGGVTDARYAPTGHLVYMRLGDLMAVPFDPGGVRVTGAEATVVAGVMQSINSTVPIALDTGAGQYGFSSSGTLVYVAGALHPDFEGEVQWIGRDGSIEPIALPPRSYFLPRLSPDGGDLAIGTYGLRDQSLWRYNFQKKTLTRLTFEGRAEEPVWSRDGTRIAFASSQNGFQNLFVIPADGSAKPQQVTDGNTVLLAASWTVGDTALVLTNPNDIVVLPLDGSRKFQPLLNMPFVERMPELSPDGRWLAYVSDETGRNEVYVQAFPGLGSKRLISTDGGTGPGWSRDGRTLTFLSPADRKWKVVQMPVTSGATLTVGTARVLFELDLDRYTGASAARSYEINADGSRFIFVREKYLASDSAPREIHLVQNWFTQLKEQVR